MVYVTAVMPYVILLVLLIRGLMLPGSVDGLTYFINPDLNRLLDPTVSTCSKYTVSTCSMCTASTCSK